MYGLESLDYKCILCEFNQFYKIQVVLYDILDEMVYVHIDSVEVLIDIYHLKLILINILMLLMFIGEIDIVIDILFGNKL